MADRVELYRAALAKAYMQGYREGRESVLAERPQTVRRTVAVRLIDELSAGPRPAGEIRATLTADGFASRTIDRAKVELRITSRREGAGWVWSLPRSGEVKDAKNASYLAFSAESGQDAQAA